MIQLLIGQSKDRGSKSFTSSLLIERLQKTDLLGGVRKIVFDLISQIN